MSKELIEQLTNYLNMLPSHARERQGAVLLERCRDELAKQVETLRRVLHAPEPNDASDFEVFRHWQSAVIARATAAGLPQGVGLCDWFEGLATQNAKQAERVDIDIVFDGPPSHEAGRFVEVENMAGKSIKVGEWIDRGDGYWALRINVADPKQAERVADLQNVLKLRIKGDPFCFWCGGKVTHCRTCELAAVLREGKE